MKRLTVILLLTALLCGCTAPVQPKEEAAVFIQETEPIAPTVQMQIALPAEETETEAVAETMPFVEEPETMPTEEAAPEQPEEPRQSIITPETDNIPPAPQPPAPQPAIPTVSVRPTSSATCKDTGSDQIWENPDGYELDYYEEKDPARPDYLEYLKKEGNPYFYWLKEESMRMYLGRSYGMVLHTSYEMLMDSTWASSDPAVATVNQVGFVVPLKEGETVITVTWTDPQTQDTCTRQCSVRVEKEPLYTYAYLEQQAHKEAKKIAELIMNYEKADTDLERIGLAAGMVYQYVTNSRGTANRYVFEGEQVVAYPVPGYNQPFGTLITRRSSCAGDVRALGLVLEYMGYEWYHVNEDQWDHQWCVVYDVDGQTAYADGSTLGIVGYGERPENVSDGYVFRHDKLIPAR